MPWSSRAWIATCWRIDSSVSPSNVAEHPGTTAPQLNSFMSVSSSSPHDGGGRRRAAADPVGLVAIDAAAGALQADAVPAVERPEGRFELLRRPRALGVRRA